MTILISVICRWERVPVEDAVFSVYQFAYAETEAPFLFIRYFISISLFTNRFSNGAIPFSVNRVIEWLVLICSHSFKAQALFSQAVLLSHCLRQSPGAWVLFSAGQLTAPRRATGQEARRQVRGKFLLQVTAHRSTKVLKSNVCL